MVMPDQNTEEIDRLTVRATEFRPPDLKEASFGVR
jgi:hypothetical protein